VSPRFTRPELLSAKHEAGSFDCEVEPLNTFLKRYALQNQKNDSARTFVSTYIGTPKIAGYYSLCAASAGYEQTPARIRKGLARHDVPMVLLARLAVDAESKGQGLGVSLLQDAFGRFLQVQETIGARGLLAHAKGPAAKTFYERWGFVAAEGFPYHLYILTKDIKASLNGQQF